jgi:hypothetical protein
MIEEMPHKGDTEETSQKICLGNSLFNFECYVNGTSVEDFEA